MLRCISLIGLRHAHHRVHPTADTVCTIVEGHILVRTILTHVVDLVAGILATYSFVRHAITIGTIRVDHHLVDFIKLTRGGRDPLLIGTSVRVNHGGQVRFSKV